MSLYAQRAQRAGISWLRCARSGRCLITRTFATSFSAYARLAGVNGTFIGPAFISAFDVGAQGFVLALERALGFQEEVSAQLRLGFNALTHFTKSKILNHNDILKHPFQKAPCYPLPSGQITLLLQARGSRVTRGEEGRYAIKQGQIPNISK